MLSFATQEIEILRPLFVRDNGSLVAHPTDTEPARTVEGCDVQPGATAEVLEHANATLVAWTVQAPAGVDVESTDRVRYRGVVYAIGGEPARWPSPTGALAHTTIALTRWKGGPRGR